MMHEFCGFRRLGMAAAVTVSLVGSIVLVNGLITPGFVQLLRTPELVAVLALFVLPALTLATMRKSGAARQHTDQPSGPRRSQHDPAADSADRAERHRRRTHGAAKA
jgi:hypothetical protein